MEEIPTALGPSRWLPWPLDQLSRTAWDEAAFWARRLSHVTPLAVNRTVGACAEGVQRPWLEKYQARLSDGSLVEYTGTDAILRSRLLTALGAQNAARVAHVLRFGVQPGTWSEAALSIVEIPSSRARRWAAQGYVVLPHSVHFAVDLRRPERALWDTRKRERVRRIEKSDLMAEHAGIEALDEFYERLYVPTALARHGRGSFLWRRHFVRRAVQHGRLVFVIDSGERVAALLVAPRWGRPRAADALLFGVRSGDYAETALAREAAYLFALRWARDEFGAQSFGLTSAPPLLEHGLLRYKKRWGAEAVYCERPPICLALRVQNATPAVRRALAEQPLVCVQWSAGEPRLCALVASANGAPPRAVAHTPGIEPRYADSWPAGSWPGDDVDHAPRR